MRVLLGLMDTVLVRLTPTTTAPHLDIHPEVVVDILWATALPDDRLEHVRVRAGTGHVDIALFHRHRLGIGDPPEMAAVQLCQRACDRGRLLRGWTVQILPRPID